MGSDDGLRAERPERDADTGPYLIDRYPVSNARYKRFLDAVRDHPVPRVDADWGEAYNWDPRLRTFPPGLDDFPVVMVSYADAQAFAAWARKQMPSEAEWEKAAGWDHHAGARRPYPWGPEWDSDRANSIERLAGRAFPPLGEQDPAKAWLDRDFERLDPRQVGLFEVLTRVHAFPGGASALGVMDLAGNVHEWCEDCPAGGSDDQRACRGGSFADHPFYLRTSSREVLPGKERYDRVGFRCVVRLAQR
jgi:iron(II)-dependent oxidoreductase